MLPIYAISYWIKSVHDPCRAGIQRLRVGSSHSQWGVALLGGTTHVSNLYLLALNHLLVQGMIVFKVFLFDAGWRSIYIFTSLVNFFFSIGQVINITQPDLVSLSLRCFYNEQVILIQRWNVALGIPDIVFALGDSAIMYFLWAINSMPTSIMVCLNCPCCSERKKINWILLVPVRHAVSRRQRRSDVRFAHHG